MDEIERDYHEVEEEESYAKLEGPGFKHFINRLVVYLGRDPDLQNPKMNKQYL